MDHGYITIWLDGHTHYDGLGWYCNECDRECASHADDCSIWKAGQLA